MTVYMVSSLPKLPYIHRMYMVLANHRSLQRLFCYAMPYILHTEKYVHPYILYVVCI